MKDMNVPEETTDVNAYEAPKVEQVMLAEDLAREVQYAGITEVPV